MQLLTAMGNGMCRKTAEAFELGLCPAPYPLTLDLERHDSIYQLVMERFLDQIRMYQIMASAFQTC
jgi:hypothetical protein